MFNVPLMGHGKRVKELRAQARLTLAELSQLSDVDVGTIHAIEKRDSARSDFFPRLARALGITFEQLIDPDFQGTVKAIRDASTGRVLRVELEGADDESGKVDPAAPQPPGRHFDALTEEEQRFLDNFREIAADEDAARELIELVENKAARMRAMKERWMAQAGIPVPPAKRAGDAKKTAIARAALDVTEQLRQHSLLDPASPPEEKKH